MFGTGLPEVTFGNSGDSPDTWDLDADEWLRIDYNNGVNVCEADGVSATGFRMICVTEKELVLERVYEW